LSSPPKLQSVFIMVDMTELYGKQTEALFMATPPLKNENGTL